MSRKTWWERLDGLLDRTSRAAARWRWLWYLLSAAMVAFFVWLIWRDWRSLSQFDLRGVWSAALRGFLVYPLSFVPQIVAWKALSGAGHSYWMDIEIYVYTHLMRRLPGGLWHWAGRVVMYREAAGTSSQVVLRASLLEWVLLLLGAISSFGLSALVRGQILSGLPLTLLPILGANLLLDRPLRLRPGAVFVILYCAAWWIGGLIVYWLCQASPGAEVSLPTAVAVWVAAGGIGVATFFLPAGLGIRELSVTFFLRPYMPMANALAVAVLLRLIFVAGDLLWGGPVWALAHRLASNQRARDL